jgi:hypothetical protein
MPVGEILDDYWDGEGAVAAGDCGVEAAVDHNLIRAYGLACRLN